MLADGEIITCLRNTILNNSYSFEQSILSNNIMSITLPILTPPSPIKLTHDQLQIRRAEIQKFYDNNDQTESMYVKNISI